jgi:adhesin/invasin
MALVERSLIRAAAGACCLIAVACVTETELIGELPPEDASSLQLTSGLGIDELRITGPADVVAGECSTAILVELGKAIEPDFSFDVSAPAPGQFYADPSCGMPSSRFTISAGGTLTTLYFRSTAAGPVTVTAVESTGASATGQTDLRVVPAAPASMRFARDPSPVATAGEPFASQPQVELVDAFGNVATNAAASVALAAYADDACTSAHATAVDAAATSVPVAEGLANYATVSFRTAGPVYLRASTTGLTPICSPAVLVGPAAPDHIDPVEGDGQVALVLATLGVPPRIRVADRFGNSVPGVSVRFSAWYQGGLAPIPPSLGSSTALTAADGTAATSLTLGSRAGTYHVRAEGDGSSLPDAAATGRSEVTLEITAMAADADHLELVDGDNQSGVVTTTLSNPLRARVVDRYGNPKPDVTLGFTVLNGGASLSPTTAATDATGTAGTSLTFGTSAGPVVVRAEPVGGPLPDHASSGTPYLNFVAAGLAGAADHLVHVSGNGQTAPIASMLGADYNARVVDRYGNPVGGVQIAVVVVSGGGSVSQALVTSAASSGFVSVRHTLGTVSGAQTVRLEGAAPLPDLAASDAATLSFTSTATPGPADHLELVEGDGQTAAAGTALATNPKVRVVDRYGNPVAGTALTVAILSGGGSVGSPSLTSAADGTASTTYTLGTSVGAKSLSFAGESALPDLAGTGRASITIGATAVAGPADHFVYVSGDVQAGTVGTPLAADYVARVVDRYGNPVGGTAISAVVLFGNGSVTPSSPTSAEETGLVAVRHTLGTILGAQAVRLEGAGAALPDLAGLGTATMTFGATMSAGPADHLVLVEGDGQSATVGTAVATAPKVRVVDRYGNRVTGVSIGFTVLAGGGSAGSATATSDADGTVSTSFTLGTTAGANQLRAEGTPALPDVAGSGNASITFNATATPGPADHLELVAGDGQTAAAGTAVATAPKVRVVDRYGNPIAGTALTVTVVDGGGSPGTANLSSAADGTASTSFTLGTVAGANSLRFDGATALPDLAGSGNASLTFTATGTAGPADHLVLVGGDSQTAAAGAALGADYVARVVDRFENPVGGAAIAATVTAGGGSVGSALLTSAAGTGLVSVRHTLGTAAGAQTVRLQGSGAALPDLAASGAATLTFASTATPGPADHLILVEGDAQTGAAGDALPIEPKVRVVDRYDNPVEGASITFTVLTGGGSVGTASAASAADGTVSTSFTLGTGAGANSLMVEGAAALPDLAGTGRASITFTATGVASEADHLDLVAGDGQTATVNTEVAIAPAVRVVDRYGNPVPGAEVEFMILSGDGDLGSSSAISAANGVASTSYKLGMVAGVNTMQAAGASPLPDLAGSGRAAITFTETGVAGSADHLELVEGDAQSATVGTAVATAPKVRVVDRFGNPVAGTALSVTVLSGGGSVGSASLTSDADGTASTSFTLGTTAGDNWIRFAGAPFLPDLAGSGAQSLIFTATGVAGPADHLVLVSGDGQTAEAWTALPSDFLARVVDRHGNPVSGAQIGVTITAGGGTLTLALITSDDETGLVSTHYMLGPETGVQTVLFEGYGAPLPDLAGSGNATLTFTATSIAGPADHFEIVGGDDQVATAGSTLDLDYVARVVDRFNNPVGGADVAVEVTAGGGSVSSALLTSAAITGLVSVRHTLGTGTGAHSVRFRGPGAPLPDLGLSGRSTLTFTSTATAGPADHLVKVSGDNQTAQAGAALPDPLRVRVVDRHGNPVEGEWLDFTVLSGGGTVTSTSGPSAADGIVDASYTVGATAGGNTISVAGASPLPDAAGSGNAALTFTATTAAGAPVRLILTGPPSVEAGACSGELTVEARDANGNPAPVLAPLTVELDAGGPGDFNTDSACAESGQTGSLSFSIGDSSKKLRFRSTAAGPRLFTASGDSLDPGILPFVVTPGPAHHLVKVSGDGQTAQAGAVLSDPLVVRVVDSLDNPVGGVDLTFSLTGTGALGAASATTDGAGEASTTLTLGLTAGTRTVQVARSLTPLPGTPATVQFTATAVITNKLLVSGPSSLAAGDCSGPFTIVTADEDDLPIHLDNDVEISLSGGGAGTFHDEAGCGLLTEVTSLTIPGGAGQTQTAFWFSSTAAGPRNLGAAAPAFNPGSHPTAVTAAAPDHLVIVAGDNQQARVNAAVAVNPKVLVTDRYDNPVAGVSLTFTATSGGGSVGSSPVLSDGLGVAATTFTLGPSAGANQLTVAREGTALPGATGDPTVTFAATATVPVPTKLALSGPATVEAGQCATFTVTARDGLDDAIAVTPTDIEVLLAGAGTNGAFHASADCTDAAPLEETTIAATTSAKTFRFRSTLAGALGFGASATGLAAAPALTVTVTSAPAHHIAKVSGDGQDGGLGLTLPNPLVVRVLDEFENPVIGTSVAFNVISGGGLASPPNAVTNAAGEASTTYTVGFSAGANVLQAERRYVPLPGVPAAVTFTANGASSNKLALSGPSFATAGTCSSAFTVTTRDAGGSLVVVGADTVITLDGAGAQGRFYPATGCADGTHVTSVTVPSGDSQARFWFKSNAAGALNLGASSNAFTGVTRPLTVLAAGADHLVLVSGDGQTTRTERALPAPIRVKVVDLFGNPVSGSSVRFRVTLGGGTLAAPTVLTASDGIASNTFIVGPVPGLNTLVVEKAAGIYPDLAGTGGATLDISATGVVAAPTKLLLTGPGSAVSGQCSASFRVASADTDDSTLPAVSDIPVTLGGAGAGAFYSNGDCTGEPITSITIAQGTMSNVFFFKTTYSSQNSGFSTFTAAASGLTGDSLNVSIAPAPAHHLVLVSGDGQSGATGYPLDQPFMVRLVDEFNNPVAGAPILFTVASGGGTMNTTVRSTDLGGHAWATLTLGTEPGPNTVRVERQDVALPGTPAHLVFDATAVVMNKLSLAGPGAPVAGACSGPYAVNALDPAGFAINLDNATSVALSLATEGTAFFHDSAGCGSAPVTSVTIPSGGNQAQFWALVQTSGSRELRAQASGMTRGLLSLAVSPGPADHLNLLAGDNQWAFTGHAVQATPIVKVVDRYENPVSGVQVSFSIGQGGGSVGATPVVSNSNGDAATSWTLGLTGGLNTLLIARDATPLPDLAGTGRVSLTLQATAVVPVPKLLSLSGPSSTSAGACTGPFTVSSHENDSGLTPASPASDLRVSLFGAGEGAYYRDPLCTPAQATDHVFIAAATSSTAFWYRGTLAEGIVISATSTGLTGDLWGVNVQPGAPHHLAKAGGDLQAQVAGTQLAYPLRAVALDEFANQIPGVPILFTTLSGGATLRKIDAAPTGAWTGSATSGTEGFGGAPMNVTLGATPGQNTVRAERNGSTLPGNPSSVVFELTGLAMNQLTLAGPDAILAGDCAGPYTVAALEPDSDPFVVTSPLLVQLEGGSAGKFFRAAGCAPPTRSPRPRSQPARARSSSGSRARSPHR